MSEIKIRVKLDGQELSMGINDINAQLDQFNDKLDTLDQTSDEFKKLTEDINTLKKALEEITVSINTDNAKKQLDDLQDQVDSISKPVEVDVKADTSSALSDVNILSTQIDSVKSDSNIDIVTNVDTSAIDNIKDKEIEILVNSNIDGLKSDIGSIEDKTIDVTIDLDQSALDSLDNIKDKEINVEVNSDQVVNEIYSINDKTVSINTDVNTQPLDDLNNEIDSLQDKDIKISTNVNTDDLDGFITKVDSVDDKIIKVSTDVNDDKLNDISDKIDNIENKDVIVSVTTSPEELNSLEVNLNDLQDKEIDVKTNVDQTELESLKSNINDITDPEINIGVTTDTSELDTLNTEIDSLQGKDIEINSVVNSSELDNLVTEIDSLQDKEVSVDVNVSNDNANESLDDVSNKIKDIQDDSIIKLSVSSNKEEIDSLINSFKKGKLSAEDLNKVLVKPKVDTSEIDSLDSSISDVSDKEIDVKVDTSGVNELNSDLDQTSSEIDSINSKPGINPVPQTTVKTYAQLKKEVIELQEQLENTDPKSSQFKELEGRLRSTSIEAIQAKEKLNDFQDSIKISTGSPLEQFKNSLQLTKEGLFNLDFEKAKTGFNGIGTSVKGLFGPLKGLRGALLATGIGALIVGIGLLIANFDDLKEAIFGITGAQKDNLDVANKLVESSQEQLDALNDSENILKLQGKTEKEILDLKIKQTDELIAAQQAQLQAQKDIKQSQIEAAERNRDILVGILNFVSVPLKLILETVDGVGNVLGKNFGLVDQLNSAINQGLDKVGIFDAKATEKEADDTIKASEKALLKLQNQRAGFQISQNNIDKEGAKKALEEATKYREELDKLNEKYLLDNSQKITEKYQKELDAIKGVTDEEQKLREAIIQLRDEELAKSNFDTQEVDLVKLDKAKQLEIDIAKLRTDSLQELARLELDSINLREEIALRQYGLTEDEKTLISLNAEKERDDLVKSSAESQSQIVIDEYSKQSDKIKEIRDKLLSGKKFGIGLLGTLDVLKKTFDDERALAEKQYQDLKSIQEKIIEDPDSTFDQKKEAQEKLTKLTEDQEKKRTEITDEEIQTRNELLEQEIENRADQIGQVIDIINTLSEVQIESDQNQLNIDQSNAEAEFARRREAIEQNIQDETKRKDAIAALDGEINNSKLAFEKKGIDIQKREIKRERNATLASIALSTAQSIAKAAAAGDKTNPVSFALTIAANLVAAYAAIRKANDALKSADSAIGNLGAGGGGGSVSTPSPSTSAPSNAVSNVAPTGFGPDAVNPVFDGNQFPDNGGNTNNQQFVSVVEIERVRNSVAASERDNTIG